MPICFILFLFVCILILKYKILHLLFLFPIRYKLTSHLKPWLVAKVVCKKCISCHQCFGLAVELWLKLMGFYGLHVLQIVCFPNPLVPDACQLGNSTSYKYCYPLQKYIYLVTKNLVPQQENCNMPSCRLNLPDNLKPDLHRN